MKKKLFKKILFSVIGGSLAIGFFSLIVICSIIAGIGGATASKKNEDEAAASTAMPLSAEVEAYRSYVETSTQKYGIPDYVDLILADMMQESHGAGTDVMQCSACGYNTLYRGGTILDPYYSIDCGVQYMRDGLVAASASGADDIPKISIALQGYNFGLAYVTWALNRGGYSHDNAVEYSNMQKQRLGWSSYGDVDYVQHVLRYYKSGIIAEGVVIFDSGYAFPVLSDWKISQEYKGEAHTGIDIAAPEGTIVVAAEDGTVTMAQQWDGQTKTGMQSYGNCIDITGTNTQNITRYAHLKNMVVKEGQQVKQGQIIGYVGNTGNSFGNHCHFEYRPASNNHNHANPRIILLIN